MYTTPSNKFLKILKKKEEKKKTTNWTITLTKLESPKGTGPKTRATLALPCPGHRPPRPPARFMVIWR